MLSAKIRQATRTIITEPKQPLDFLFLDYFLRVSISMFVNLWFILNLYIPDLINSTTVQFFRVARGVEFVFYDESPFPG